MISRIDVPNQASFTSIEGRQPYFAKWTTPMSRIRYAETVYSVRSTGMAVTWYSSSDGMTNNRSTAFQGYIPILKNWYGKGQPEVFTNQQLSEWAVKYEGWFRSPITADYTFSFAGEGELVDFQVSSVVRLDVTSPRAMLGINQAHYASSQPFALNADQWTKFLIKSKVNKYYRNL